MDIARDSFRTPEQIAQAESDAAVLARIEKVATDAAQAGLAPGAPTVTAAPTAVGQTPVPVHTPKPDRFLLAQYSTCRSKMQQVSLPVTDRHHNRTRRHCKQAHITCMDQGR